MAIHIELTDVAALSDFEECGAAPCQDGRCVGSAELCGECETDGDCAWVFAAEATQVRSSPQGHCVPDSDCATNSNTSCPDNPLQ